MAGEPEVGRGAWAEARIRELPKYVMFLYNLLLDQRLPDEMKTHVFGTLVYVMEDGDVIPRDDRVLGFLDEVMFTFRCLSELVGRLPPAMLAVYEEVLFRDGIPLRDRVREAPANLGKFFFALAGVYKERIERYAPSYKNATRTGHLVRLLQQFMQTFQAPSFTADEHRHIEAFIANFGRGA